MSKEIERKFLLWEDGKAFYTKEIIRYVTFENLRHDTLKYGARIRQGYLPVAKGKELTDRLTTLDFEPSEIRLRSISEKFYLTVKSDGALSREELETELKKVEFDKYWPETKGRRVEKIRSKKHFNELCLEFDVYIDRDLIICEAEFASEKLAKAFESLGLDVTENKKYKNKNLAK